MDQSIADLSQKDFELLLLTFGLAAGAALRGEQKALFWSIFRLANTICTGRPGYTPYLIAPEFLHDQ